MIVALVCESKTMSDPTTLDFLLGKRAEVADKLRSIAPQLMGELDIWDGAIRDLQTTNRSERYLRHKLAIGAIIEFLEEAQKPVSPNDIVAAVLDGGWLKSDPRRRLNVYDSLLFHVRNKNLGKLKLFDVGEKITTEFLKRWNPKEDTFPIGLRVWKDPSAKK